MNAFLDIETSWNRRITVIGVYRAGRGTAQLVAPDISRQRLLAALEGTMTLFTYNGAAFDLPVIARHLGVHLGALYPHRDLLFECRRRKLKGGLKGVERLLGIHRDTEGVDGIEAMNLWDAHQRGHAGALDLLLRYNREDCENLEIVAQKLGLFGDRAVAAAVRHL